MNKKLFYKICIYLLLIFIQPSGLISFNSITTHEKYILKSWNKYNGLPHNSVNCIIQDTQCYIWIGTEKGVARFDGSFFKIFNKTNTKAIKNNSITSLFISKDGTLWIGTNGGGITSFKKNIWKNYSTINSNLQNDFISSITQDNSQNIWIGTNGGGLIQFDLKSFTSFTYKSGLSSNFINSVFCDKKGNLFIGTENGLNRKTNGKFTFYSTKNRKSNNFINSICEDKRGNIWIGTSQGLNLIKKGKYMPFKAGNLVENNLINSILQDAEETIWIATSTGLYRLIDNKIENFNINGELIGKNITSLYEDKTGNIWVCTIESGIFLIQNIRFRTLSVKNGLSHNYINVIYEDNDRNIWIGTQGGGLNKLNEKRVEIFTTKHGLSSNYIKSIFNDRKGNLWIGTDNGLNQFINGKFKPFTYKDGLSNNSISSISEDTKGNLWIGTFGGGLNQFKDGKFFIRDSSKGLSNDFIFCISEDINGNLWIGTRNGLNCYYNKKFKTYTKKQGLTANIILDIFPDKEGTLWIGTQSEGLLRFKNNKFIHFAKLSFSNSSIYRVIEDNKENLWLSSNEGIFSVSKRELNRYGEGKKISVKHHHLQESNGLKTSIFTGGSQPAGWKTKDGLILFPSIKGVLIINLKKPILSTIEQPVIIEKVLIDNISFDINKKLKFPAGTNKIQFFFSAPNFSSPEKIRFRFRLYQLFGPVYFLSEYNKKSIKHIEKNRIELINLHHGRYKFEIIACNSTGEWNSNGAVSFFSIDRPFYLNPLFYIPFIIMLVILFFVVIKWAGKRSKEKDQKFYLMDINRYQTSLLNEKKSKKYLKSLIKLMEKEKPHLDPNMTLQKLSKRIGISKEELSRIINQELFINFNQFLNKYRTKEAKEKLKDTKENQYVILKIAYDVGFNSKSAFNTAFKKNTGLTPLEYRKKHQTK